MTREAILVLDDIPQTLEVVRSLSRAGYHIILGLEEQQTGRSASQVSRHCHEIWRHPQLAGRAFADALISFVLQRQDLTCIFPTGESSAARLLRIEQLKTTQIRIPMVNKQLFDACRNKIEANALAARAGLNVPAANVVSNLQELRHSVAQMGFPLIIKSVRTEARVFGRKAYLLEDATQFARTFSNWPAEHHNLMVQAYIRGKLESADFVASQGVITGYCEVASLRTDMPDGTGFTVDFESIAPTPLLDSVRKFVSYHQYSGPGLIQFIRCNSSNMLYFIENNPRLAAGIAHPIVCGQNLPMLALQASAADYTPAEFCIDPAPYRYGVRCQWLKRDLDGYIAQRHTLSVKQKLNWLVDTTQSFITADCHMTWDWQDPLPTLLIYLRPLKQRLQRAAFSFQPGLQKPR